MRRARTGHGDEGRSSRPRTQAAAKLHGQELTTQQAADLLNVSREFLVGLLESGVVPYHKAGARRRIYAKDVLRYKARHDRRALKALRDLVDFAQRNDIYLT